jgi:hypothetical protein
VTFPRSALWVVIVGVLSSQSAALAQATAADAELLKAARLGDLTLARQLLSKGAAVNTSDRRGVTPLMWAAADGNTDLVRHLLENGAVVDRRASDGTTALMLASANGFLEVVRALVLRGADVAAASGGIKARQIALQRGHSDVAKLLEQAEALGARLLQAATEGHDALVRQLLALGAPANVTDERGTTALMIAARNGDLGILQALLSRGADPSVRDSQGRTVFESVEPGSTTAKYVVAFLVDRGTSKEVPRSSVLVQSPEVSASLVALATALARIPPASDPLRMAERRASAALSQLQKLSTKWPANSPDDYRDNLARDVEALNAALKLGDAETLVATVESVAEDLEIKLEHCVKSGGRLGGSVVVRVRTVQGSAESRNWRVFYMPKVFEAAPNASPDLFLQLSSPTEETLVPGRYVMWARNPVTAQLSERTVVKVGEGRKELLLDLPVPSTSR